MLLGIISSPTGLCVAVPPGSLVGFFHHSFKIIRHLGREVSLDFPDIARLGKGPESVSFELVNADEYG